MNSGSSQRNEPTRSTDRRPNNDQPPTIASARPRPPRGGEEPVRVLIGGGTRTAEQLAEAGRPVRTPVAGPRRPNDPPHAMRSTVTTTVAVARSGTRASSDGHDREAPAAAGYCGHVCGHRSGARTRRRAGR
jgi:hypothetical protein